MNAATKTLYLCGVGNGEGIRLALTVNRAQARWAGIVLLDDDAAKHGSERLGLRVAGGFDVLAGVDPAQAEVVNLVTRTTAGRAAAQARIAAFGVPFTSLVHPGVDLEGVATGVAVTVYAQAVIGAECTLGAHAVVLVGAVVGHGARVGEGCIVAPNAVINARVDLGTGAYVGCNASILPDIRIGAGATIGANTLVYADVPAGATALGVPAQLVPAIAAPAPVVLPAADAVATASPPVADSAALAVQVAEVMARVLGVATVARDASFFDSGGTSLKALALCQALRDALGRELDVIDIYRYPTLHALTRFLAGGDPAAAALQRARERAGLRRDARGVR